MPTVTINNPNRPNKEGNSGSGGFSTGRDYPSGGRTSGDGYSGTMSSDGGYSSGSNSSSKNGNGIPKGSPFYSYSYLEILGVCGDTSKHDQFPAQSKQVADIIQFMNDESGRCWGSNALHGRKVINLSNTGMQGFDLGNLAYTLRNFNFNLEAILLNDNYIGDHGDHIWALINGITSTNMQTLYNPNGWQPYTSNIPVTQSVVYLNLSNTNIGDEAAKRIADGLLTGRMASTQRIDLSGNNITQDGDTKIVQALKGVKQDIVVFTRTLDEINKVGGDEGKEAQITALKNIIERGKAIGTYDKAMVVDRSLWGSIKHNIKKAELSYNHLIGFGKCHFSPEEAATSYAQDKIIATLPDKTSSSLSFAKKYAEKLVNFHNIITCFVGSYENSITAELGQEVVKHELCVVGVDEFCGE